jgi:hypothetical protein
MGAILNYRILFLSPTVKISFLVLWIIVSYSTIVIALEILTNLILGDTDTRTAKYGATPLTWSSPNGCIDVNLYARQRN